MINWTAMIVCRKKTEYRKKEDIGHTECGDLWNRNESLLPKWLWCFNPVNAEKQEYHQTGNGKKERQWNRQKNRELEFEIH